MDSFIRAVDAIHADRVARFTAEAERAALARRSPRPDARRVGWIRRAVGRSIVRIGARIAAEPAAERLQPAGSR
jgi:hypothetical protein